jgi:HdeA/HdeB family protein
MTRHAWLALIPVLLWSPAVSAKSADTVDATQVSCSDFRGRNEQQQKRLVAFLQGYENRGTREDTLGEAQIGGLTPIVAAACDRDPQGTVWQQVQHSGNIPDVNVGPKTPDSAAGSTTQGQAGTPSGNGNQTTGATTRDGVTRVKPLEYTCGEFSRLSPEAGPEVLYWLDGYNRKDDMAPQVDLARGMGPYQETCRAAPHQSLWTAVRLKLSPEPEQRSSR